MAWYLPVKLLFQSGANTRQPSIRKDLEQGHQDGSKGKKSKFESYDDESWVAAAGFMNKDPDGDLWIFRRFRKLQLFNILCIQERLTRLENEFEHGNSWEANIAVGDQLRKDIQSTLEEYDNALSTLAKFRSYRKPRKHMVDFVHDWTACKSSPLWLRLGFTREGGSLYIDDLASIGATEKSWIHRFIDKRHWLRKLFKKKRLGDDDKSILIYFEDNVRKAETFLIHGSFWVLLFSPVIVLTYLPNEKLWKLLVVVVFLLLASLLSATLLNTPNSSGLALVAGYAAILVVFVTSNVGQ